MPYLFTGPRQLTERALGTINDARPAAAAAAAEGGVGTASRLEWPELATLSGRGDLSPESKLEDRQVVLDAYNDPSRPRGR